ncbi:hypothetical protein [Cupriavidus sp. CP313]
MLKDEGIAAYQTGATAAGNSLMESAGAMGQVAGGLALVVSTVTLVMAIEDGNGYQIASAALSTAAAGMAVAGYTSYCPRSPHRATAARQAAHQRSWLPSPTWLEPGGLCGY